MNNTFNKPFDKNRSFKLNNHDPDQFENTYTGEITINDKTYWLNAKDRTGPSGPFISGRIGKEKQPRPEAAPAPIPTPAPAPIPTPTPVAPAISDDLNDDMPF